MIIRISLVAFLITQVTVDSIAAEDTMLAGASDKGLSARPSKAHNAHKHVLKREISGEQNRTTIAAAPAMAVAEKPDSHALLRSYDKIYGYKGWDFPFPSFADTILQDYGGWRSALAKYGFGFSAYNDVLTSINLLNVPTSGPGPSHAPLPGASRQQYFGQRPGLLSFGAAYLTYDTRQYGVPDGQLSISGEYVNDSWQAYSKSRLSMSGLAWYQTLFNKAVEIKVGYIANGNEWAGTIIGGNLANPFGTTASILYELGMSLPPAPQPTARVTWHLTDELYNEAGVMRSIGINGPTGNTFYDDYFYNPTGFRFTVPNGRLLVVDELGYKTAAAPNSPETWLRFGIMYNNSEFPNFKTGGTTTGVGAAYFLADRQIWQIASHSPATAYRGVYAGITAMYAPPENTAFSQNYEARLYAVGVFDSRPLDLIAFSYDHNVISRYIATATNEFATITGIYGRNATNTVTLGYTARLIPGVYLTFGVAYTDHPSITYTKQEGSAVNFQSSLFTSF